MRGFTFYSLKHRIRRYIPLVLVIFLSIMVRIPRVAYVQGQDMFVLASESFSLIKGESSLWLVHPLSYFGMFSFSGYPIGSVALFACMLIAGGFSLETATLLYTFIFAVVSVPTFYILSKDFFESRTMQFLGTTLYQFTPIIYEFTYDTASARAPLLAFLPLFVHFLLQSNRGRRRPLAYASATGGILMLFHRAALVLFILVLVAWLYGPFMAWTRRFFEDRRFPPIRAIPVMLFVVCVSLIILGIVTFGIYPKNSLPPELSPEFLPESVLTVTAIGIDYSLFYGPLLLLSVGGLFDYLFHLYPSRPRWSPEDDYWALLLFVFLPFTYFIAYPAYTRHFLGILVVLLSVRGLKALNNSNVRSLAIILLCVLPSLLYFHLYNLLWRPIYPYAEMVTLCTVLFLVVFALTPSIHRFLLFGSRRPIDSTRLRGLMIALMVMTVSVSYMDMRTVLRYEQIAERVPSDDELAVAAFVRQDLENHSFPSIVVSQHHLVEIRVAAYGQTYALADGHGTGLLAVGYVTRESALVNSTFGGLRAIMETHVYRHPTIPAALWYALMKGNWSDSQIQSLIYSLRISHFIALKGSEYYFGPYGEKYDGLCVLSQTISLSPVYETGHFIVYSFIGETG